MRDDNLQTIDDYSPSLRPHQPSTTTVATAAVLSRLIAQRRLHVYARLRSHRDDGVALRLWQIVGILEAGGVADCHRDEQIAERMLHFADRLDGHRSLRAGQFVFGNIRNALV